MIPHIPNQRRSSRNASKPFNDLVSYIQGEKENEQGKVLKGEPLLRQPTTSAFDDIVDYATASVDRTTKAEKCVAIRTHGVTRLDTASRDMNAVAANNKRCKDPAYHFILSWPEHEKPAPDAVFDAAEHAIKALGLGEHQYVIAIHDNTDNMHCHISVNRVHPVTFQARHIEWATKTLHMAARQSEIKHGWTHDRGIYVVDIDGHGQKHVVLNKETGVKLGQNTYAHQELGFDQDEQILPAWHDPDSLESWLKKTVTRKLKNALMDLSGWHALHAWLDAYGISLNDSGGGGMRLKATSPETGELLDMPASKGFRFLKRGELEKRWGAFVGPLDIPCNVPDLSHLTQKQISKGVNHVLTTTLDRDPYNPGRPPEHVLRAQQHPEGNEADRTGGLHELPFGGVDDGRQDIEMPLQDAVPRGVGNRETGQDQDLRRAGVSQVTSRSRRSLNRDDSKRAERKEERALARVDLRDRYAQYKRFVNVADTGYFQQTREFKTERSRALKEGRDQLRLQAIAVRQIKDSKERFVRTLELNSATIRMKLEIDAKYQEQTRSLQQTRVPPLGWREWLYEQSNLGDKAALSALRGIVYQAKRDAKEDVQEEEGLQVKAVLDANQEYKRLMQRLLYEERREAAIRSAALTQMRAYEVDPIIARYAGIQWQVTGNGNVEYSAQDGNHLFTDRGNRVTFDRDIVADNDIRIALVHAQQKFGNSLTLTGPDDVFTARMARLGDDMGLTILNPELQSVIAAHRTSRQDDLASQVLEISAEPPVIQREPEMTRDHPGTKDNAKELQQEPALSAPVEKTVDELLRERVLAIDPRASFVVIDNTADGNIRHTGPIVAHLDDRTLGFAQQTGRGVYAIHTFPVPEDHAGQTVGIKYAHGQPTVTFPSKAKGKGRS